MCVAANWIQEKCLSALVVDFKLGLMEVIFVLVASQFKLPVSCLANHAPRVQEHILCYDLQHAIDMIFDWHSGHGPGPSQPHFCEY